MMANKKILIVDDSLVIIRTLSMKLNAAGFQVVSAEDGGTAVSAVRREKPDAILLDINFPPDVSHGGGVPWDGFLIMDWIRRLDEGRDVPVIFITSGDPGKFRERSLAAGAVSFFKKPIDCDKLIATIRAAIICRQENAYAIR